MRISGAKRKLVAVAFLAILALLAWYTMDPGKVRLLVMVLLGGFALRVALTTRGDRDDHEVQERR